MPTDRTVADASSIPRIVDRRVGAAEYAHGDEALLARGARAVRVALLETRCLSYGVGARGPYLRRAEAEGIPIVARRSGGTGLLHEVGDLAWTVVLPRDDPRVGRDFARAYARLGRGVVRWLGALGVECAWTPAPGTSHDYCMLSERGWVLVAGDRILGGAAQHLVRSALLHHGTISVTVDRTAIDRLFGFVAPSPSARLGGLRELGIQASGNSLADGLSKALEEDLTET